MYLSFHFDIVILIFSEPRGGALPSGSPGRPATILLYIVYYTIMYIYTYIYIYIFHYIVYYCILLYITVSYCILFFITIVYYTVIYTITISYIDNYDIMISYTIMISLSCFHIFALTPVSVKKTLLLRPLYSYIHVYIHV